MKLSEYAHTLEFDEDALDLFISSLVSDGWLSNERYCEQFIHAKKNKFGRYKIIRELEEKGRSFLIPDEHQKKLMEEKRAEYMVKNSEEMDSTGYPKGSQLCSKCQTKAVIMMDGCLTCLSCGDSKCG